jgi:hypothetical protein
MPPPPPHEDDLDAVSDENTTDVKSLSAVSQAKDVAEGDAKDEGSPAGIATAPAGEKHYAKTLRLSSDQLVGRP